MPQELISPEQVSEMSLSPRELGLTRQFLERLTTAFADPSSSGSIWLSHKRCLLMVSPGRMTQLIGVDTYEDGDVAMDDQTDGEGGKEHDVLIRCTKGDTKFSSRVSPGFCRHCPRTAFPVLLGKETV